VTISDSEFIIVNKLLFQKLVTVFCAILDAASMSNNWILIDRTRPSESSTTAELLLECAIRQTNQRPSIIVIESMERFSSFNSTASKNHLKDLQNLAAVSNPITSDGSFKSPDVHIVPLPYVTDDYHDHETFHDKELPCEPLKEHIRKDTGEVANKRKWMYHYSQTTFSSGTHYIFLESAAGAEAFPLHTFGPLGFVAAHGGTLSYKRLRARISQGRPLVMLHQTGGATQAFASLHRALTATTSHRKAAEQVLREIDLFSGEQVSPLPALRTLCPLH